MNAGGLALSLVKGWLEGITEGDAEDLGLE
jgi:hypothetical protein